MPNTRRSQGRLGIEHAGVKRSTRAHRKPARLLDLETEFLSVSPIVSARGRRRSTPSGLGEVVMPLAPPVPPTQAPSFDTGVPDMTGQQIALPAATDTQLPQPAVPQPVPAGVQQPTFPQDLMQLMLTEFRAAVQSITRTSQRSAPTDADLAGLYRSIKAVREMHEKSKHSNHVMIAYVLQLIIANYTCYPNQHVCMLTYSRTYCMLFNCTCMYLTYEYI